MMSESKEHFVKVYKTIDPEEKKEVWKADPGKLKAHLGDMVTWRTEGTDVTIYFPAGQIFLNDWLTINSNQQKSLTIRSDAVEGPHPYAIFCHSGNAFAKGSAHPVIIIERRD